jgi:transcription elongation factor GreA
MPTREIRLTQEGWQNLEKELEHLVNVRRREVVARIHKASESDGTVDNAEYDHAKNEQAFLEGRIAELENILANAVVASGKDRSKGAIEFGSSVTVRTDAGARKKYTIVGSAEANPLEGKISVESPVGQALMGHKVGDKVDVETPSGISQLTIVRIK